MTERERAYAKQLRELMEAVGRYEASKIAGMRVLLETARKDVAARVAVTDWQAYRIDELKRGIGDAMKTFERQITGQLAEAQGQLAMAGLDVVDGPLAAAGITAASPQIALESLELLQGYSADLITNLSQDAVKKITGQITQGVLGGKSPFEVMQAIGKNLDDKSVFSSIAVRAETIQRTEMGRVHSLSRASRMDQVVAGGTEPHVEFHKKWIGSGKAHARADHAALDGVMVPYDEDFPGGIPFPHAPGLDAADSINCGCSHILTMPDWEDLPTSYEPAAYQPQAAIYD